MTSEPDISFRGIKLSSIVEMSWIEFKDFCARICIYIFLASLTSLLLSLPNLESLVEMNLIKTIGLLRLLVCISGAFLLILIVAVFYEIPASKKAALDISRRWIA